jgi:hypothetical protein
MSASLPAFVTILLRKGILSQAQVEECRSLVLATGVRWEDALVKLGYATHEQVMIAVAESRGLQSIDLSGVTIPPAVIELIPESVARENVVLPLSQENNILKVIISDPSDFATLEKLQFILRKDLQPVVAPREQIIEAINRHYGQAETESVDSMLAEFTDTAIDFTKTESVPAPAAAPASARKPARRPIERRATVRYYERMNPDRLYPLLVILSRAEIEKVAQANVGQKQSEPFRVEAGSVVEIEPILPGCDCYPPRAQAVVTDADVQVEFWVAPRVVGPLRAARVIVRQEGRPLAEVPLEARVSRQAVTWLMAGLSCVLPFVLLLLKHFRLDFESQSQDGFGLYAQIAGRLIRALTPETLLLGMVAATVGLYLWLRPRRRDVFWDVKPVEQPDTPADPVSDDPREELRRQLATLKQGNREARTYFRASLAAHQLGDTVRALVILRQAEADLGPERLTARMWYNMTCFAARLGQVPAALGYLGKAIAAGYTNADKLRTDPDLAGLRSSAEFQRLLTWLGA